MDELNLGRLATTRSQVELTKGDRLTPHPLDRVADLKQQINQKIGRFALRSGETLHLPEIYADETNDYDICDVQGKMCF